MRDECVAAGCRWCRCCCFSLLNNFRIVKKSVSNKIAPEFDKRVMDYHTHATLGITVADIYAAGEWITPCHYLRFICILLWLA